MYRADRWTEGSYKGFRINVTPPISYPFVCECGVCVKVASYIYFRNHELWKGCVKCESAAKERLMKPENKKKFNLMYPAKSRKNENQLVVL